MRHLFSSEASVCLLSGLSQEQCNQIDLLTANPLPEDALLCAVPVTAPYSAMTVRLDAVVLPPPRLRVPPLSLSFAYSPPLVPLVSTPSVFIYTHTENIGPCLILPCYDVISHGTSSRPVILLWFFLAPSVLPRDLDFVRASQRTFPGREKARQSPDVGVCVYSGMYG